MRYGSIYLIKNKINDYKYVGLTTTSVEARWASHKCESSTCTYLHNALRKYGSDNFTVVELASSWNKQFLEELESYFIKLYDCVAPNGYNLTTGGGFHGKQSDITKQKKSESHKNRWQLIKKDEEKYTRLVKNIKKYVNSKKTAIISVCLSTANIEKYNTFYETGLSPGSTHTAIRTGGHYKNRYWFYDKGQTEEELLDLVLIKLKGRWQLENINPIVAEHYITGEVVEFLNIWDAKDRLKIDVGLIRKCFTGRLTRAKEWKFKLK